MKSILRSIKDWSYEEIEVKVRNATSNEEEWPSSAQMEEIARATNDYRQYKKCFTMLWHRMHDYDVMLHVYKALLVIEYCIRHGSDTFVVDIKRRKDDFQRLKRYRFVTSEGVEKGERVRFKANQICDLLEDDKKLDKERKTAEKLRDIRSMALSNDNVNPYYTANQASSTSAPATSSQDTGATGAPNTEQPFEEDPFDTPAPAPVTASSPSSEAVSNAATSSASATEAAPKKKGTKKKGTKKTAAAESKAAASSATSGRLTPEPVVESLDEKDFVDALQGLKVADASSASSASASSGTAAAKPSGGQASFDFDFYLSGGVSSGPAVSAAPAAAAPTGDFDILTSFGGGEGSKPTAAPAADPFAASSSRASVSSAVFVPTAAAATPATSAAAPSSSAAPTASTASSTDVWSAAFINLNDINAPTKKNDAKTINTGVSMGQARDLRSGFGMPTSTPAAAPPAASTVSPFGAPAPQMMYGSPAMGMYGQPGAPTQYGAYGMAPGGANYNMNMGMGGGMGMMGMAPAPANPNMMFTVTAAKPATSGTGAPSSAATANNPFADFF